MLTVDLHVDVGNSLSKSEHTVVDLGHGGAPRLVSTNHVEQWRWVRSYLDREGLHSTLSSYDRKAVSD